ncbi:DUF2905 domain-containing protein [Tissierella creatinini]|nr:DUF2905 domain-containing protein [Tissierella creatinini]TJX69244.1 DUF2905 domain-containing protein [Soehngenia saccharolytica]
MNSLGKIIIILGVIIMIIGLIITFGDKIGLGRLPGDIYINRGNFKFYFPITTSIIISIMLSIIALLLKK